MPNHRAPAAPEFRSALLAIFDKASREGLRVVDVKSGDVHRALGVYPKPNHNMPTCCSVMRSLMKTGDLIIAAPPKGNGATLLIRYRLPR